LRRKETHKPRVIFSVTNCICHDQRVLKMAQTVSHLGTDVWIVGRRKGKCCDKDNVAFKTVRFRMLFKRGFLFYKFFNIRLFFFLLFRKANLLVSNDLDTLFPNYLVSRLKRIPLVYDSHEYFTGVPEIQDRPIVKFVWTEIEKMIFPKLKNIMTVSDPIADRYEGEYGIRPLVVRNYSRNSDDIIPYGKEALGIDPDHFLLIYQGTGINRDRGGEELIEAIAATSNVSLLVVGSGDLLNTLKDKVMTTGISNRVHFIDSIPWEELMRYTKSADAGVSLDKNDNINYRYSLPNKLFDYISAGIPVIAGDLPEVTKIVTGYNCGLVIPEISPGKIKEAINRLSEEKKLIDDMRRNASKASSSLNWENEALKVSDFYRRVLNKRQ
jgi:glycosyltransferase involved in cell wall biosynthesis